MDPILHQSNFYDAYTYEAATAEKSPFEGGRGMTIVPDSPPRRGQGWVICYRYTDTVTTALELCKQPLQNSPLTSQYTSSKLTSIALLGKVILLS